MSSIDKRALREAAEKATKGQWAVEFDDEIYSTDGVNHEQIAMVFSENEARDAAFIAAANPTAVLALLDELKAKDSTIATQQQEIRTLLNALGQASEKRNAEQAGIIAKQEKWIKDVEETMISATDRAEAAEKRIADQSGIIESARKFISEYAGLGDVGAAEFVKIIDRAAAAGKGEAS
ncbi:ead/Ea22-like family protein [Citrobacter freundii]|nr:MULTISPECIES: ead/Ea22-like family protein [Enterobacteriaceae]MDH1295800.1 ead/Ea22-like family protein [Citrobacter freundii]MDT7253724.1 ead/Ea22-like family protein [Citrobacter freundii]MDT7286156.1 ead/Ea22-like family protein [Citrobacter freundii]MDV2043805.1 ead/Ea22-like family protein [Citrobacter freundii]MDW3091464.1 ead/Ea22-like family protein [Citrobacter freundii]